MSNTGGELILNLLLVGPSQWFYSRHCLKIIEIPLNLKRSDTTTCIARIVTCQPWKHRFAEIERSPKMKLSPEVIFKPKNGLKTSTNTALERIERNPKTVSYPKVVRGLKMNRNPKMDRIPIMDNSSKTDWSPKMDRGPKSWQMGRKRTVLHLIP